MSFIKISYLPGILFVAAMLIFLGYQSYKLFRQEIAKHWGCKLTRLSTIRLSALVVFLVSTLVILLDPRGPVENIERTTTEARTLIVLDVSSSMLVEDVRPNRLERALLLARHFVKNAVGHKIGIVIFSNTTKLISPFTQDRDVLDARLNLIKDSFPGGASHISIALQEAIQHFSRGEKAVQGNILLLTDGEESDGSIDLDIPDSINIAAVGIGTVKGGRVPVRDNTGRLRGYKYFEGKEVISKMDESFLQRLGSGIKNYQFYPLGGYGLPTTDILSFFQNASLDLEATSLSQVRPVKAFPFSMLALLSMTVFLFLKRFRLVAQLSLLISLSYIDQNVWAQDEELSKKSHKILRDIEEGLANQGQYDELASEFLQRQEYEKARDVIRSSPDYPNLSPEQRLNYGTSLLGSKNIQEGMKEYKKLYNELSESDKPSDQQTLEKLKNNLRSLLQTSQSQSQESDDDSDSEDKRDQSDQQSSSDQDQTEQDQDSQDKQSDQGEDQKGEDREEDDQTDEQNDGEDSDDEQQDDESEQNHSNQQDQQQKVDSKEIPGLLQQLVDEDRKVQKELIDTNTRKKETSIRDW